MLAHIEHSVEGKELKSQLLKEHLYNVGTYSKKIGDDIGIGNMMKLIGYLHDMGKSDRKFQSYIKGSAKKHVNHSSAGVRVFYDLLSNNNSLKQLVGKAKMNYFIEIISYVVFSHHGLFDLVNMDKLRHNWLIRYEYDIDEQYYFEEDVKTYVAEFSEFLHEKGEMNLDVLIEYAYNEWKNIVIILIEMSSDSSGKVKKQEFDYYIGCFTRLSLSILKEADIYDSANVFQEVKQRVWEKKETDNVWKVLRSKIEFIYQEYEQDENSPINKIRNKIAKMVKDAALINEEGIYQFEVPTGAGKTKAGLRYALNNASIFHKQRVFYVTAFLSVLEQNAEEIRNILDYDEIILEHHSNVAEEKDDGYEDDEDQLEYSNLSYMKESWEVPFILTTMVQLCSSLFKEKASNIRRFCKLINSVIILDEVQSLPLKVLSNFNLMMNFMKNIMKCNIVHCTATQPELDSAAINYPIQYGNKENKNIQLIDKNKLNLQCFDRVDYYNLTGENGLSVLDTVSICGLIKEQLYEFNSCLVVLNTKSAVEELYQYTKDNLFDCEVVYLTTNLCAAHRLNMINRLKDMLLKNRDGGSKKILCISTKLVEAGVDLDFDLVLRSLAGIDSLVQCGGRCNREGKLSLNNSKIKGKCYIIRYDKENMSHLPDIKETIDSAEYSIRNLYNMNKSSNDNKVIYLHDLKKLYYNKYYIENALKLDYIKGKDRDTMLGELSSNQKEKGVLNHVTRAKLELSKYHIQMFHKFKTAATEFSLIDEKSTTVIVPYQNMKFLDELTIAMEKNIDYKVKSLLKRLQRYTISVYETTNLSAYVYENKKYGVKILQEDYYDSAIGINIKELATIII